ncbi:MAG: hypothetical protein ABFD08_10210 [Syntrophomonas sp.]
MKIRELMAHPKFLLILEHYSEWEIDDVLDDIIRYCVKREDLPGKQGEKAEPAGKDHYEVLENAALINKNESTGDQDLSGSGKEKKVKKRNSKDKPPLEALLPELQGIDGESARSIIEDYPLPQIKKLVQRLGVEAAGNGSKKDTWVSALMRWIKEQGEKAETSSNSVSLAKEAGPGINFVQPSPGPESGLPPETSTVDNMTSDGEAASEPTNNGVKQAPQVSDAEFSGEEFDELELTLAQMNRGEMEEFLQQLTRKQLLAIVRRMRLRATSGQNKGYLIGLLVNHFSFLARHQKN